MALTVEQKAQIVKDFQRKEGDTGSSEVQVALLTFRINDLTPHFKANPKDHHSRPRPVENGQPTPPPVGLFAPYPARYVSRVDYPLGSA